MDSSRGTGGIHMLTYQGFSKEWHSVCLVFPQIGCKYFCWTYILCTLEYVHT